jgi:hypothetical protein
VAAPPKEPKEKKGKKPVEDKKPVDPLMAYQPPFKNKEKK